LRIREEVATATESLQSGVFGAGVAGVRLFFFCSAKLYILGPATGAFYFFTFFDNRSFKIYLAHDAVVLFLNHLFPFQACQ